MKEQTCEAIHNDEEEEQRAYDYWLDANQHALYEMNMPEEEEC